MQMAVAPVLIARAMVQYPVARQRCVTDAQISKPEPPSQISLPIRDDAIGVATRKADASPRLDSKDRLAMMIQIRSCHRIFVV
jgi:hypothetical protein